METVGLRDRSVSPDNCCSDVSDTINKVNID